MEGMDSKQDVTHCLHEPCSPRKRTCIKVIVPAPSAPQVNLVSAKKFLIFPSLFLTAIPGNLPVHIFSLQLFSKLYLLPDSNSQGDH